MTNLREAMTMKLNQRLNECGQTLGDRRLLAKLSAGDVVAHELKYHPGCLVALYNRERAHLKSQETQQNAEGSDKQKIYPIVFSELVTYVNEMRNASEEGSAPVIFKLADLVSLYSQRLEQLGVESPDVNRTRLKEQLLERIPELEAHRKGRDVLFAFRKDVGAILASKYSEAIHIAKAAEIIRKEMLHHTTTSLTLPWHNSYNTTVMADTRKGRQPIGTLRSRRLPWQCTLDCLFTRRRGRDSLLSCYMTMECASLMIEFLRSLLN